MQRSLNNLIALGMLAAMAVAQTTAKPQPVKPMPATTTKTGAANPAAQKPVPAKPSPKTAQSTAVPAKAAAKPAAVPAKTTATAAKTPAAKPAAAKAEAKKEAAPETAKVTRSGRRDPFVSPVRLQEQRMATGPAACNTGAACLQVNQISLLGVVKTQKGMIAMVQNAAKKQYNLHENDKVYNGEVVRITGDSIVFRENAMDSMGRPTTREVVKRVTAPSS